MSNRTKLIVAISLPLQIICFRWLSNYPEFIESFYSQGFYPYLSSALRSATGLVTIPIGQFLLLIILLMFTLWLVKSILKLFNNKITFARWLKTSSLNMIVIVSGIYFLFISMWGLNYNRQPITQLTNISQQHQYVEEELNALCHRLITLTNASRKLIKNEQSAANSLQIINNAQLGFNNISKSIPELAYHQLSVKSVIKPQFMSWLGISGIYFPFTGEANINGDTPWFSLPFTTCHEMAHQLGFAREDEANYIAYLACRHNPDHNFQYAANFAAMRYSLRTLEKINSEKYVALISQLSDAVVADLKINQQYWKQFESPINKIQNRVNDTFLKANHQQAGTKSYSIVVELLLGEFQKNQLKYDF